MKLPQKTDTLTIPEGVHMLSKQQFDAYTDDMNRIRRVVLPEGVREMQGDLFGDTKVKEFQFPESLTAIDLFAVAGTPWSKKLLETGEPIIINGTLVALQELPDVVIPDNVKRLATDLFDPIEMETLHIGARLCEADTLIDTVRYNHHSVCGLREITISPDNPYFTVKNNCLLSKDGTVLYLLPFGAEQVIIPDGVLECACDLSDIFWSCEIKTLSIPHTLRSFYAGSLDWKVNKEESSAYRTVLMPETKKNAKLETIATEHFLIQIGSNATEVTVPLETELKVRVPKGTLITFQDTGQATHHCTDI